MNLSKRELRDCGYDFIKQLQEKWRPHEDTTLSEYESHLSKIYNYIQDFITYIIENNPKK